MPVYVKDNGYLREIEGSGENLPTRITDTGDIVYQYRHIFTGPTFLEQQTGNPVETWDFAGLAFATPSGAPYDKVARIIEGANNAGGTRIYTSRPVDMSYQLADGSVYYHQHYTYAGSGQGYIVSEGVDGSYFDTLFYKARFDNYDAGGRLTSQYYQDGNGANLMYSEYWHNPSNEPWASVEIDYLPNAQGQLKLAHHIYTAADGSVYADVVYRSVNGIFESYTTGSAVTAGGYALRVDRSDFQPFVPPLVQQQFFDGDHNLQLTIDDGYIGPNDSILSTKTYYGAALDDAPYQQIVDYYFGMSYGVWKRVYDMRDGSHTIEIVKFGEGVEGTSLGPGVVNADDTYALYGGDMVYFEGRFGTDTLYNFLYATTNAELGARLNFETSQFADLAAVRAAATSGGGADITITNGFGDKVVLKSVLVDGATIDDVLNNFSVTFSGTTTSATAPFPDAGLSGKMPADGASASGFVPPAPDADLLAGVSPPVGTAPDYWA